MKYRRWPSIWLSVQSDYKPEMDRTFVNTGLESSGRHYETCFMYHAIGREFGLYKNSYWPNQSTYGAANTLQDLSTLSSCVDTYSVLKSLSRLILHPAVYSKV